MNEDAWEDLDTWERRDHELIKEYLNEAPVELGNERWMLRTNKSSEMMAFGESNWKDSWIAPDGWKEFSQSKTIMRGWHMLEPWILKRMEQDLRETLLRSSNVENDDEKHQHELLRYSRMNIRKIEPTMKIIWKILEKDIWLMAVHSYVKLWKNLRIAPEK